MISLIELDCPTDGGNYHTMEFMVDWYWEGDYHPATEDSPAEWPERLIQTVRFVKTGKDVPDDFFERMEDEFYEAIKA